jgi:hypothetical protein
LQYLGSVPPPPPLIYFVHSAYMIQVLIFTYQLILTLTDRWTFHIPSKMNLLTVLIFENLPSLFLLYFPFVVFFISQVCQDCCYNQSTHTREMEFWRQIVSQ